MAFNYKTQIERYRRYYQSLEPMMKTTSSRAYTSIVFSFLAVSLFGWYAIRPTIQTILSLRREISDKTQLNKQMEDKITALIEAQAAYQEAGPLLSAVALALPQSPDVLTLAQQLQHLASTLGVTMTSIQIPAVALDASEATPTAQTTTVTRPTSKTTEKQTDVIINLALEGSFPALKTYLDTLNSLRRVVTVDGFTISVSNEPVLVAPEEATQSAVATNRVIQLALKVKAYYLAK